MRKTIAFLIALLGLTAAPAMAQPAGFTAETVPAVRGEEIVLNAVPTGGETWTRVFGQVWARNVQRSTLYVIRPMNGRANGKSVIVVPGGGYMFVSIDSEGFRVADRLAAQGYTAFVLKYRVNPTPPTAEGFMAEMAAKFGQLGKGELPDLPPAVDDLASAITAVKAHAAEWKLDPTQIGAIGFSAGSRTLIRLIEQKPEAALLHHVGLIYPPMTQTVTGGPRPPLFLAIAAGDPLFKQGGLKLVDNWLKESNTVEFHLYIGGEHGFGMMPKGTTSDRWIDQYIDWLAVQ
ncbi:alpha/beta hydrolase [Novosphingobium sp. PASSN1]|uniref:alpha/beta hydrolase n=1 Tax=Novosphingobium sp. PASSN1 TaxID=2015561 RepID=UPI000BDD680E|nr:alpha/beta hydrolase [Novosphingobium sp. PASSN1]OYU35402.1 MAG: esterase [Novosphingobium sp. PASSN1]